MASYPVSTPSAHPIDPAHLAWLCQPERLLETLRLLFSLAAWQQASARVLSDDRQGLATVLADVLSYATRAGLLQPTTYLDGTHRFPGALLLDSAVESAARGVELNLRSLCRSEHQPPFVPEATRLFQHFIRPCLRRLTGQDFPQPEDAARALEGARLRAALQWRLDRLIARARQTRQPLATRLLAGWCFAPLDLLPIGDNRAVVLDSYESWEELAASDRRRLDPEGESQVALTFQRAEARVVFHLPLRTVEAFVPAERLEALRQRPGSSQECCLVAGQAVEEAERLGRPVQALLQELGIEPARVCPHGLVEKATYLAQPGVRDLVWPPARQDPRAWADDPWDGLCLPPEER